MQNEIYEIEEKRSNHVHSLINDRGNGLKETGPCLNYNTPKNKQQIHVSDTTTTVTDLSGSFKELYQFLPSHPCCQLHAHDSPPVFILRGGLRIGTPGASRGSGGERGAVPSPRGSLGVSPIGRGRLPMERGASPIMGTPLVTGTTISVTGTRPVSGTVT